jgi:hypothetical protein|tara:strand:- start:26 stop:223 length:198 start_codon:yes stop_codon:yes gene_type:complete
MKRYLVRAATQITISVLLGIPLTLFWDYLNDFLRGCVFGAMVVFGSWSEYVVDYILGEEDKQDNQ